MLQAAERSVMSPGLMQVRKAAERLGVHENTLRRWEQAGWINAVRLPSGVRRFQPEEVERLREQIYGGSKSGYDAVVGAAAPRPAAHR
jgi:excisionase family DNA binding protein